MITIRLATIAGAAAFLALREQIDHENKFMLLEPGERQTTVEQERERGLHRLELTVMTNNPLGIALYQKMGFQREGTARDALRVDGEYVDLHYMSKLLT